MTNGKTQGGQAGQQAPAPHLMDPMQGTDQGMEQGLEQNAGADQEQDAKRAKARTEAEARSIDGKAGQSGKSSHDHMGHIKAGSHEGAGGGAKSKRHH